LGTISVLLPFIAVPVYTVAMGFLICLILGIIWFSYMFFILLCYWKIIFTLIGCTLGLIIVASLIERVSSHRSSSGT
jgi:hypothetical protein